ncbi:WD40/YVTN/BNR-like repeat-containing protein [Roseinatronobacter alkalisoli]|uniref:Exo-alpha-sialidase n=1 Tax=Roseinatronobacter alkalisoli TaxID=3028235 RepID=A0ABT5T6R4_9RHOB|nr:hypothetical protein [Roseinatronobacter sp. HJB301]MDD7970798.1 hypothetical protein [Roseinatronobacter sp. HJB301]
MNGKTYTFLSRRALLVGGVLAIAGAGLFVTLGAGARAGTPLTDLLARTHIHGLAVDGQDSGRLLIATHHGLHALDLDTGLTVQISDHSDDLMGFVADPVAPAGFLASGHPAHGGNLGVIASSDGGASWTKLSDGVNGPVDFHQMDISKADPSVVWGNYGGLQRSRDGGRIWEQVADAPPGLISIAASAQSAERLYAATETGLFVSDADARDWQCAHPTDAPVTFVEVLADGMIHAFILGEGLVRRAEDGSAWEQLHPDFEQRFVLHYAADPANPDRAFAATQLGEILASDDGGRSWHQFGTD